MNAVKLAIPLFVALAYGPSPALAVPITLGPTLSTFAVLGGTSVTNDAVVVNATDKTIINGNLGACLLSADAASCTGVASITGVDPGFTTATVNGTIHRGDATARAAAAELRTAYNLNPASGDVSAIQVVGGGLSGTTRAPGVYAVASATLDLGVGTTLTLAGTSGADQWVFLMSSALITGTNTLVDVSSLGAGDSVYWVVRSSATIGVNSEFAGDILALASITFALGATDECGRALAQNGLVSFAGVGTTVDAPRESVVEANKVGGGGCASSGGPFPGNGNGGSVPEPSTLLLLGFGLAGLFASRKRLFPVA